MFFLTSMEKVSKTVLFLVAHNKDWRFNLQQSPAESMTYM